MKLSSLLRYASALPSLTLMFPSIARAAADDSKPIVLNSRRELMVDSFLISTMKGVELKLQKPEARDVAITCDALWEGNPSAYDEQTKHPTHPELTCFAESQDGLTWDKPNLGVVICCTSSSACSSVCFDALFFMLDGGLCSLSRPLQPAVGAPTIRTYV